MQIIINRHNFRYEMENIARMFFHSSALEIKFDVYEPIGDYVLTEIRDNKIVIKVSVFGKTEQKIAEIASQNQSDTEWQMAEMLYSCLCTLSGKEQKWGLLTGVRPTRLVHRMLDEGKSIAEIRDRFINFYKVSEEKFRLLCRAPDHFGLKAAGFQPLSFHPVLPVKVQLLLICVGFG